MRWPPSRNGVGPLFRRLYQQPTAMVQSGALLTSLPRAIQALSVEPRVILYTLSQLSVSLARLSSSSAPEERPVGWNAAAGATGPLPHTRHLQTDDVEWMLIENGPLRPAPESRLIPNDDMIGHSSFDPADSFCLDLAGDGGLEFGPALSPLDAGL